MITLGKIAAKVKSEIILDRILPYVVSTRFPKTILFPIFESLLSIFLDKLFLTSSNVLKLKLYIYGSSDFGSVTTLK